MRSLTLIVACFVLTACVGFGISSQVCLDPKPVNLVGKTVLGIEADLHAKCLGGGINADTGKMEFGVSGAMSTPVPAPSTAPAPPAK